MSENLNLKLPKISYISSKVARLFHLTPPPPSFKAGRSETGLSDPCSPRLSATKIKTQQREHKRVSKIREGAALAGGQLFRATLPWEDSVLHCQLYLSQKSCAEQYRAMPVVHRPSRFSVLDACELM